LRVQNKIERLIDKHMLRLGAAKVSLSSLSSEDLWQRSGRLDKGRTSELLTLEDRKGTNYLLSPTHEEEITTIFANAVKSYKELPLRLYQVSRKYRDEPRPRQGLLRGREFVMKDLYTFDTTEEQARKTYDEVRKAYVAFLEDLRLPYLTARADSGNMGGDLSHEYHFASPFGEDTIIKCDTCDYSLNEELYVGELDPSYRSNAKNSGSEPASSTIAVQHYLSKDRKKLCTIYYPAYEGEPNIYAVKALFPSVDSGAQVDTVPEEWLAGPEEKERVLLRDPRLSESSLAKHLEDHPRDRKQTPQIAAIDGKEITLTKALDGDMCPNCNQGKLKLHQAVEIGHTFHLGTRYSIPLDAHVLDANNKQVPVEMGCHGIGVSRLIGAAASLLADKKGLNWPVAISPFGIVVVPAAKVEPSDIEAVYDRLAALPDPEHYLDVALDDRDHEVGWKLNDADLVGYPFIVVIGRAWRSRQAVELQCRRLGVNEEVPVDELEGRIREHSKQL
jgi:prolyl-tRNA synthetase